MLDLWSLRSAKNSREVGVKLSKDVLRQVEELEEGIIKEEIKPSELMNIIPDSICTIDRDGRKRVNLPGDMWSLKILDKLLSGKYNY